MLSTALNRSTQPARRAASAWHLPQWSSWCQQANGHRPEVLAPRPARYPFRLNVTEHAEPSGTVVTMVDPESRPARARGYRRPDCLHDLVDALAQHIIPSG
jgi:hypothetical protein